MAELYRHYDEKGTLLYVGISLNTIKRLAAHRTASAWFDEISRIEIERFPTRMEAMMAERAAIRNENPVYNIAHRELAENPPNPLMQRVEESEAELYQNVACFQPVYKIDEAISVLKIGRSVIQRAMDDGTLGYFETLNGKQSRRFITGWQLIEYLEYLASINEKET